MAKLILLRHGESVWNSKNLFTGWVDVPLSQQGIQEAIKAGETLAHIHFDIVFTSVQIRAMETALLALAQSQNDKSPVLIHSEGEMEAWGKIYDQGMAQNIIPIYSNIHLNERYYGELQGKNKTLTAKKYGEEQVLQWRRSYATPPPNGESLKDTAERTIPFFKESILPQLAAGNNVLVSAHGNSLRSIIMFIENMSEKEIVTVEIPTGHPLFYEFNNGKLTKQNV
jgi:2,3-bisphosphoglycerate-dependent phosphoglycerate mutase